MNLPTCISSNRKIRYTVCFVILITLSVLFFIVSVCAGSVQIPLSDIWRQFRGEQDELYAAILFQIRIPRTFAAILLGGALALSGYLLQTFFHNPIAGPFVLGISSGAKLFVAVVMIVFLRYSRTLSSVDLIVRGICCILPGIAEETENLTVTSIVGRYLEHPRVFVFGTGAEQKVYIGSADMMTRNTEKRVEVACPILNEEIKKRLVRNLHVMLADNVKARAMTSDGTYRKKKVEGKAINSQEIFMKEALMAKRVEKKPQKQTFLQKMRRLFQKE